MRSFTRRLTALAAVLATSAINVAAQSTKDVGSWEVASGNGTGVVCIHAILLPGPEPWGENYKLLCAERVHPAPYTPNYQTNSETSTEVDVKKGTWITNHPYRNPFCSGHAMMADGNIFFSGGDTSHYTDDSNVAITIDGRTARRIYTPYDQLGAASAGDTTAASTRVWNSSIGDMSTQRWYPYVVTLADEHVIIVSGSSDSLDFTKPLIYDNPTYEYYPEKSGVWPKTIDILQRAYPYNLYPPVFQLPKSGKVWIFSGNESAILNTNDETIDDTSIPRLEIDGQRGLIYPDTPTTVMLPLTIANNWTSTMQICGGTLKPTNDSSPNCARILLEDSKPTWDVSDPMPSGKVMPNGVLLPDGTVLYCNGATWGESGGSAGDAWNAPNPSFATFIYNHTAPAGTRWKTVANTTIGRLYHSGALLLPDGKVVTTGNEMANYPDVIANRTECYPYNTTNGGCTSPFEYRLEIFTPPYFYNTEGTQPVIDSAPRNASYGSTFYLNMKTDGRDVKRVTLIRYGTTTHSINPDQRFVEAEILSKTQSRLVVRMPANGYIAPPGYWMLWALNAQNTPSHSWTFKLRAGTLTTVEVDANNSTSGSDGTGSGSANGDGSSSSGSSSGSLSTGAIVGIVVGVAVAAALIIGIIVLVLFKKRRNQKLADSLGSVSESFRKPK